MNSITHKFSRYIKCQSFQVFFFINYKMTTKQLNIKNKTYYFYNDKILSQILKQVI